MPSTQEGFGIVFLEATASGVRAIGGNADGSVDALADGAMGTSIDPVDTDALVRAINDGLSESGRKTVGASRFAFENFAGKVCELVGSHLLGQAGSPRRESHVVST
jgi:glycosyltransferase involved in cell wall biosynthesis